MRRQRLCWLWAVGLGILALTAAVWLLWTDALGAPRQILLVIPEGTESNVKAGREVIPQEIRLRVGDIFILRNDDIAPHRIAGFYVRPGGSLSYQFKQAGTFEYICTVHPEGHTTFRVDGRPSQWILLWAEVGLLGILMQVSGLLLGGWSSRRGSISVATGTAIVFLGLFLGLNASGLMLQETFIGDNPYPSDTKSLETGQRFYLQFCEVCHGISGRGDGPLASSLDPPPADLIVHVPLHPDYILFRFAQEGIPGTSMVPLGEKLANEEIWHLVNYIQTLK